MQIVIHDALRYQMSVYVWQRWMDILSNQSKSMMQSTLSFNLLAMLNVAGLLISAQREMNVIFFKLAHLIVGLVKKKTTLYIALGI